MDGVHTHITINTARQDPQEFLEVPNFGGRVNVEFSLGWHMGGNITHFEGMQVFEILRIQQMLYHNLVNV